MKNKKRRKKYTKKLVIFWGESKYFVLFGNSLSCYNPFKIFKYYIVEPELGVSYMCMLRCSSNAFHRSKIRVFVGIIEKGLFKMKIHIVIIL